MELIEFLKNYQPDKIVDLDVRPVLAGGTDPFLIIMEKVNGLKEGEVLKIINTFAPMPLVSVLGKKGFEHYIEQVADQLVHAYFFRQNAIAEKTPVEIKDVAEEWNTIFKKYKGNFIELDVRQLEMPQPMHSILEALEHLPDGKALFVIHKRIPVFLLPELAERKLEYRLNEIAEGEVQLIIFKS